MYTGLKFLAVLVVPLVVRNIPIGDKNLRRIPVLFFTREIIAAFQDQDIFPRPGQL
jgi:hypothetical protein